MMYEPFNSREYFETTVPVTDDYYEYEDEEEFFEDDDIDEF